MVRRDKASYMGKDKISGAPRRGWTAKWKCPKCGHWNPNDNWRCFWCFYQKQSHKEGLTTPGEKPGKKGLLARAYRRLTKWKPRKKSST